MWIYVEITLNFNLTLDITVVWVLAPNSVSLSFFSDKFSSTNSSFRFKHEFDFSKHQKPFYGGYKQNYLLAHFMVHAIIHVKQIAIEP